MFGGWGNLAGAVVGQPLLPGYPTPAEDPGAVRAPSIDQPPPGQISKALGQLWQGFPSMCSKPQTVMVRLPRVQRCDLRLAAVFPPRCVYCVANSVLTAFIQSL